MRYKQDRAEFIPIADGARLIQERSGLSEDESREDIVAALRAHDPDLKARFWSRSRGERHECRLDNLLRNLLNNLTPALVDWESSIARRRGLGHQFAVEIEVSRAGICRLWPVAVSEAGTTVPTADASQPDATTGGADEGKAAELLEPAIVAGDVGSVGRSSLKAEIEPAHRNPLEAGEGAERAAAPRTKAATNKMFVDLHREFLANNPRPATVEESIALGRSIGVGRDDARVLRRRLPPYLKNQRRRPSHK